MPPTDTTDTLRELRPRPSRAQIDPVAAELMRRHGAEVMASAQHWAETPEDAEDAYQRGMEIMLTKAPCTDPEQLVPWLKTVVKREAWTLRRQRERQSPPAGEHEDLDSPGPLSAHDHAERLDRLRRGAEALGWLKPNEVRALVLKAQGLSYQEICDETGWTYTKVNRSLSEGRQRFQERLAGIESGAECARLAPLLSRLADGEALAEDMALLRPHLRTCLSCRARLRDYRTAPAKVAAIAPPVAAGGLLAGWLSDCAAALALRWQQAIELMTAHKAAAVVASAAVLGGGGVATVSSVDGGPARPAAPAPGQAEASAREQAPPAAERHAPERPGEGRRDGSPHRAHAPARSPKPAPPSRPDPAPAAPGGEFAPEPEPPRPAAPSPDPRPGAPPDPRRGGSPQPSGEAGGEFAP
jgi:RNA polymerase sigma factor (sigma-70 family)